MDLKKFLSDNRKAIFVTIFIVFLVIALGFGIYVSVMFADGGKYKKLDYQCGVLNLLYTHLNCDVCIYSFFDNKFNLWMYLFVLYLYNL
jgi:hypothetical protein